MDVVAHVGSVTLVVEYKGNGETATVGSAIEQSKTYAKSASGTALPVVAVPYMGDLGKRLCGQARVGQGFSVRAVEKENVPVEMLDPSEPAQMARFDEVGRVSHQAPKCLLRPLLLGEVGVLNEVVDLPLQNATKPNRKPRRQELQWQRQHRPAFFSFGPAHGVPFTPFHALRKVAGTFSNCRNSFRFSTIRFCTRRERSSYFNRFAVFPKRRTLLPPNSFSTMS